VSNAIPSWRVEEHAWRMAPSPPEIAPIGPPPLTSGGRFRCNGEEQTEWAAEVPERCPGCESCATTMYHRCHVCEKHVYGDCLPCVDGRGP